MEGCPLLLYGMHLPSTGCVRAFALRPEPPGFVLLPNPPGRPEAIVPFAPQPKLLDTMRGYSRWSEIQGFPDIGSLNRFVVEGRSSDVVHVEEARHEQTLLATAARATALPDDGRLILIAGPSSSGKTSFAKRLAVQLRVLGFSPAALSLDDYFVPREQTPRDERGDFDFEALHALQIELFNDHLRALMAGEAVRLPRYDFHSGASTLRDESFRIARGQPLIVEGIHALNPELTPAVPAASKLRVYVSALCHCNLDNLSYIPTHLTRLFRRIVRDAMFRGYTASQTLARWPQVRAGEQKWIFPFQQNADVFFNAGLAYELCVLKLWAEPRLAAVEPEDPNYGRARSLLELLTLVLPIDAGQVPPISMLREFIGGSGFHY
jgi:uridine kinase